MAWGREREPFDGRMVLDGDSLHFKGEAVRKLDAQGKLVRIEGTLQVDTADPRGNRRFFIEVDRAEFIDRVSSLFVWDAKHRFDK